MEYKICSICEKELPATTEYFYKNKTGKDGLYPYCKECTKKKHTNWTKQNHEKRLMYLKKNNDKPERKKNIRESAKRQRETGYQREYQRKNKDKIKEYNEQHRNHEITKEEWGNCLKYFNHSCAYCGMKQGIAKETYKNYLHKDHVQHDGKNDLSNCIPACKGCNCKKWIFALEEWYNENNLVYDIERYNRIIKWLNADYKKFIQTIEDEEIKIS